MPGSSVKEALKSPNSFSSHTLDNIYSSLLGPVPTTDLVAGDIAIVSYNSDNPDPAHPDSFSFVLLRPIGSATTISFTDRGWTSGGAFSSFGGDSTVTFTASTDLAAGAVITTHNSSGVLNPQFSAGLNLDEAGDQIISYQGPAGAPTLLYATDFADGNTTFAANATNANNSALPTGLSIGSTAVAIAGDNGSFAGPTHVVPANLLTDIGDFNSWVFNDNSPQTLLNGPFLLAPDKQLWVAGSGAGEAIVHIHGDGTIGSGNTGFNLVQLFQNDANLFHPSDIVLDTVHDKYFFVDADLNGHNRIIQASISQALNNPGVSPTFTVLYSNTGTGATDSMRTLSVDTANGIIYFDIATTFNKIVYDSPNQTPTVLANLGASNFITQATIDYVHGEVYLGSSRILTVFSSDVVEKNYVYKATGLTPSSTTLTFAQLPFSPDDTGFGDPDIAPLPGEAFPVERGTVRGVDVDPVAQVLYIATGSVALDTSSGQDGSEITTFRGGVYRYNLTGNPTGTYTNVYLQDGVTGVPGLLYYIEVDPATAKYYVVDVSGANGDPGDGAVFIGNTAGGTPTRFSIVGNVNGLGPQGLELDTAPTLTVVSANPTYTEQQSAPATVQLINSATATDIDSTSSTDQMAGATVRISSGFISGVDALAFTNSGGITGNYNATTGVLTFTGVSSFAGYQTVLASVRFQATGNNPTNYGTNLSRTISWSVSDGLLSSDEQSTTVAVVGVNDAPVNAFPGPQAVNEDTNLSISGFSISDVDANPASQQLTTTLSVLNGTLTVLPAGGASVMGSGTSSITLTGTSTQINITLGAPNNVVYRGLQDYFGPDTLTFTTNDQGNTGQDPGLTGTSTTEQDQDNIGITVNPVNDEPTLTAIPNPAAILEDASVQTINLAGISEGPNESAQTLLVTAVSDNTGLIPNPTVSFVEGNSTGSLAYTPVADAFGSAVITVTVMDSGGTSSGGDDSIQRTFTVNVTAVNDAPTLTAIGDATILEDAAQQTVNLVGISNGPNETGQVNTITATSDNLGLIPNPTVTYTSPNATGSLSYTPVANANGSAIITVTISDNGGTANSGVDTLIRTFTINVTPVNDAPTLAVIPNPANIAEDSSLQTVNFAGITAGPADETGQTFVVTAISDNTAVIPNPTVSYTSPNATGSLSYTPVANAFGSAIITVTVTDNGGVVNGGVNSFQRTFTVNITEVNDAPVAVNDALASINEDSGVRIIPFTDLTTNDNRGAANESGQTLIVKTVSNPVGGTVIINGTNVEFTPTANFFGTSSFDYTVEDNGTTNGVADPLTSAAAATATFNINTVADTPSVTNATTSINTQTTSGLVISRNAADGDEVTHFKITNIVNGTLFQNNGTTPINANDFITVAQGNAGLKFTPGPGLTSPGSSFTFDAQASTAALDGGLGGSVATATITVNPSLTMIVNTLGDALDLVLDGVCDTDAGTAGDQCTLRAAIQETNNAASDDTINFSLPPSSTITLDTALDAINGSVMINGPGASLLTVARNSTGGTPDFRIFAINSGQTVTISGLTISNGNAVGGPGANSGGGISNSGTLTLTNSVVSGNSASAAGGGISNAGTLTLNNTTVSGNTSPNGAGIHSSITLSGTVSLTLNNSTVSGNNGNGLGAGLFNGSGSGSSAANLTINNSNISGNINAGSSGGGIYNAAVFGNAVSTLIINNSTISGNSADSGGGIYHISSGTGSTAIATITNSTIAGNNSGSAADSGGGIFTSTLSSTTTLTLRNTLVAGNLRSSGTIASDVSGAVDPASLNNLIGDGTGMTGISHGTNGNQVGTSLAPINPRLGPLANNGGPTQTHALLAGSPALEAGDNTTATNAGLTTDQRGAGFGRIRDAADADTNQTVDIGAFEADPSVEDIADKATTEDTALPTFTFNVGDAATTFDSITATSSNQLLVPDGNITVGPDTPSTRTLSITPVPNASGTTTITVTVTKTVASTVVTMSDTFVLTVAGDNDNPTTTGLPDINVSEDAANTGVTLTASFNDVEDGSAGLIYTVQANTNPGLFTSASISSGVLTLDYAPNAFGTADITIRATDSGGLFVEDTFTVNVTSINDAPTLDALGNLNIDEDAAAQIVNISNITDGASEGQTLTVTALSNNTSIIPNPIVTYTSPNSTGSLSFTPVANQNGGPVTITVTVTDNGGTLNGGIDSLQRTFTVTVNAVNDAPSFQIAGNPPTVNEDDPAQTVNSFATNFQPGPPAASDEAGQTLVGYTVTSTGTTGNLSFSSGPSIDNTGTLTYTPSANTSGTATFNAVATDSGSGTAPNVNQSAPVSFTITVNGANDAPVLDNTGNMSLVAINEDFVASTGTIIADIVASAGGDRITDVDAGAVEGLAVIAVDNTNGTWQFTIDSGTNWTPFGTPDVPNARLLAGDATTRIRFVPNPNFNGTIDPGITFHAWDQTSGTNGATADVSTNGDATAFSTDTETAAIAVNPVNDQPAANSQVGTTNEDSAVAFMLSGTDVETASGALTFNITQQPLNGVLSGSGNNRTYTPNGNFSGVDSFKFTVTDTGDGASPPLTSAEATVSITVNAANDGPVNNVPGAQSLSENRTLTFSNANSNAISISDVDAGANPVEVTLTATNGLMTLGTTTGLSFTAGDGANDATMSFTGTISSINTALNGLVFTPTAGFDGAASIQIITNDQGNTGSGGALSDTDTVNITVLDGGTLAFSAATYTIGESGPVATITVNRSGGTSGEARIDYATSDGTAIGGGTDYTTTTGTLIFANGVTTQAFTVPMNNDAIDESDETVNLTLSNPQGSGALGSPATAVLTITDDDAAPAISIDDPSVPEGNSGTVNLVFTVTLSNPSSQTVTVNYATGNNTAEAPGDFVAIPSTLLTFNPLETSKQITVLVNGDTDFEPNEALEVNLSTPSNATVADPQGLGFIVDNDASGGTIAFSAASFTVNEDAGSATITVNRTGATTQAVTVDYATLDVSASERSDYTTALGTLNFAAGATSASFTVPVNVDSFTEGSEFVQLTLSNPSSGTALGVPQTAVLQIDNVANALPNTIDDPAHFVDQHYHDFLNRVADPAGRAFWIDQITSCGADPTCIEIRRINVSAAFFLSIEFQETGVTAFLANAAAFGTALPAYRPFERDTQALQRDFAFGLPGSEAILEANKVAFFNAFVQRPEFVAIYGTLTNEQYVDALITNTGVTFTAAERDALVNGLNAMTETRATVLRKVTEQGSFKQAQFTRAFVYMQYVGYLRRNPADPPDNNLDGFNFWLTKLNQFNGNFVEAEMVKAFISSSEYRQRFGP